MVVFRSGKPIQKRIPQIPPLKQTQKMDDYGALREVLYRRYQKVLLEGLELPDMIIIDGGKGQVSTAEDIIGSLGLSIHIIGLTKERQAPT